MQVIGLGFFQLRIAKDILLRSIIDLPSQICFVLKTPLVLMKFLSYMSVCPRTFLKQKCGMFGRNEKAL